MASIKNYYPTDMFQTLEEQLEEAKALVKALGNGARCKRNSKKWNDILEAQERVWRLENKIARRDVK